MFGTNGLFSQKGGITMVSESIRKFLHLRSIKTPHRMVFKQGGLVISYLLVHYVGLLSPVFGQEFFAHRWDTAMRSSVAGTWVASITKERVVLKLGADGKFNLDGTQGNFAIEQDKLTLRSSEKETVYNFIIEKGQLTLSGGNLATPLVLTRQPAVSDFLGWMHSFSLTQMKSRLYRIIMVILIVIVSQIVLVLIRFFGRWVVFSTWGPLRYFYRYHKNRALTIHSVVLNVVKYVIYFMALGYILSELGVNYAAYVASLSVIGLAIGFGSQGLVQDMVTGFFIIFEQQFDVGDMVEISGQTGVVQELGLRMTKLINFQGASVILPNRNIGLVSNYNSGSLPVRIDVATENENGSAQKTEMKLLLDTVRNVSTQFEGVILAAPTVVRPMVLQNGEHFLRIQLAIWPGQQWIIDTQLVTRIKEQFLGHKITIPHDRIIVYYEGHLEVRAMQGT